MKPLTLQQQKELKRLVNIRSKKDVGIALEFKSVDERIDKIEKQANLAISIAEETQKMEGEEGLRGEQGEQGIQGEPGESGEQGVPGKDGKDGRDGKNGLDGRDGLNGVDGKNGRDGRDGIDGKNGVDGKDREPETLDTLRKKLDPILKEIYGGLRGKNYGGFIETGVKAGANISVSKDSSGAWVISSSSSSSSGFQVPTSGIVDGTNKTFTWATAPNAIVVDSGRSIRKTSADGEANWTGTTTTVLEIAPNNDIYAIA